MDKQEIQSKLIEVISNHVAVDPSSVTPDQHLRHDLGLDSLDVAEMIYEIEERFGISISDESAERIEKISDTIEFIYERMMSEDDTENEQLSPQEG